MSAPPLVLATVDQVLDRNPVATRRTVEVVLPALQSAISYTLAGAPDDALVVLNQPLMQLEDLSVADLLLWFAPTMVNDGLIALAKGDPVPLEVALDAMGLLAETGEAFARMQVELARLAEEGVI